MFFQRVKTEVHLLLILHLFISITNLQNLSSSCHKNICWFRSMSLQEKGYLFFWFRFDKYKGKITFSQIIQEVLIYWGNVFATPYGDLGDHVWRDFTCHRKASLYSGKKKSILHIPTLLKLSYFPCWNNALCPQNLQFSQSHSVPKSKRLESAVSHTRLNLPLIQSDTPLTLPYMLSMHTPKQLKTTYFIK